MITQFSRTRRFALAAFALFLASLVFRPQMSQALVVRGDEYVYRGRWAQALERYRRALLIAPSSEIAVDRYVFVSMQLQSHDSLTRAVRLANGYLSRHPHDVTVLADRALCFLHERRYALAAADFDRAAAASHSARYALFARLSARAAGKR